MIRFAASLTLFFMATIGPAYAYLDPGTGSMILQGLLAGLAVAAGVFSYWKARILGFFKQTFKSKEAEDLEETGELKAASDIKDE